MKEKLRNLIFKIWYWYISTVDKNAEVIFMNFGYSKDPEKAVLKPEDEVNRYSAQLYDHVGRGVDLKDKDILEVGCGRGGGLFYVKRYLMPKTAIGMDLNKKAVEFCNSTYKSDGLSFVQGNAISLPFENNSFDAIINVESSHRYPDMELFLGEVRRTLKPGGFFLFTDFRYDIEMAEFYEQIKNSGMTIEKKEDITGDVVEALYLDSERREKLVKKLAPKFLHNLANTFAGVVDTDTYNSFKNLKFEYFNYILRKTEDVEN